MTAKLDMTNHAVAAPKRPKRSKTSAIVIHHIDVGARFEDVVSFFTTDPEGVATVRLPGTYESKLPTIDGWRKHGIPVDVRAKSFVPYHFLIDNEGAAARLLPLDVIGAHAAAWNDRSIAVCCLGSFQMSEPSAAQYEKCRDVVADILTVYPGLRVVDHDQTLKEDGHSAKGCAGAAFPLQRLRADTGGAP